MRIILFILIALTSFIFTPGILAQRFTVSGKVVDSTTLLPVEQLSVMERHSGIGTITTNMGLYHLTLPGGEVELVFMGLNYERMKLDFHLRSDTIVDVSVIAGNADRIRRFRRDAQAIATVPEIRGNDGNVSLTP